MKLAFITSLAPTLKPDTGFEIANAAILNALRDAGHQVVVFGFARPDDILKPDRDLVLLGRMILENSAAALPRKAAWLATALCLGRPFACAKLWLGGSGRVVRKVKKHGPFDALILNSVTMAGAFPAFLDLGPCLHVSHNIEHVSAAQNATHASNAAMRWLYRREARLFERLEARLARDCRFIWCLAEEDRRTLGPGARGKSAVLPLVSTRSGHQPPAPATPSHDIGLIGTWTWEPNLIGLKWFLNEVVPLLPPDLSIAVTGRTPSDLPVSANVTLLGRVPDSAEFLGQCAVVALTSRAGTGVQLKTIETLQLGVPAVATPLSMRGLAGTPANVVIADSAAMFAAALQAHVQGVRQGSVVRADGTVFMAAQSNELALAIKAGLASISV